MQEAPTGPADAPAGPIRPDESWSPLERWIWEKLQAGEIADIDEYEDGKGRLPPATPKKSEDWQDGRRRLAPRFLEDLLLRESYCRGLHRLGVRIEGAWFDDEIDLSMAELIHPLWLDRCRFEKSTTFVYLRTPAPLSLDGSSFVAQLDLQNACIDASLFMRNGTEFSDVILRGARVGGQINMIGAKVTGTMDMDSADIGQSLLMQSLSERRAEFNDVILRGANAEAGVAKRGSRWFIDWLVRDEPYTPQPYHQCAQVLRDIGHPEMADAVLYAGRERERKEAWRSGNNPRGTGLTLLKWFVGYGYGQRLLWHPFAWVVALVAAGTAVLHLTGIPNELAGSEAAVVAYSLDTLLPIVDLEKSFTDIVLQGFAKYYFYFQKLMGWVLASFLIAGLSGLTK